MKESLEYEHEEVQDFVNNRSMSLQIGNRKITTVDGNFEIEAPPFLHSSRTMVPIRAIIEEFGGSVQWDKYFQQVRVHLEDNLVDIWLNDYYLNPRLKLLNY